MLEGQWAQKAHAVAAVGERDGRALLRLVHVKAAAREDNLAVRRPVDRMREAHRRRTRVRGGVEPGPCAVVEERRAMDVERAPAARDHLGAIHLRQGRSRAW